jgi:hypothetical protein
MQHHTLEGLRDLYHPNQKIGQAIQIITRWVYADMLMVGSSPSLSGHLNLDRGRTRRPIVCWFGPQQVSPATIRTTLLYMVTQFFYLILQILFRPCLLVIISGTSTGAGMLQYSASGREVSDRCYSF